MFSKTLTRASVGLFLSAEQPFHDIRCRSGSRVCRWWQPFVIYQEREWAQYELTSSHVLYTDGSAGDWMSCHLTYQICQALTHIHSHNITHRDLKPEVCVKSSSAVMLYLNSSQNILLTTDKPPILKIADFGLSKLVDDATALRVLIRPQESLRQLTCISRPSVALRYIWPPRL